MKLRALWTVSERDPDSGLFLPKLRTKNIFTNFGLNALASALGGGYTAPIYLVIDKNYAKLQAAYGSGANAIQTDIRVDLPGDSQLVVEPGTAYQETVFFSTVTGSGPYTYNLTGNTVNAHSLNGAVVRLPLASDTMTSVISEQQYDPTNAPNTRAAVASGYNNGSIGEWTMQFYFTGTQALVYFATLGLADNSQLGQGNLHNHFVMGYDHTSSGNDIEIDGVITIVND
jgi:hypothetical protein